MRRAALDCLAAGNNRAKQAVKHVVSYLLDHPTEAPCGGRAFVDQALQDTSHPARTHPIRPDLEKPCNQEFICNLANSCTILYDTR
jgi:hypothetical protein